MSSGPSSDDTETPVVPTPPSLYHLHYKFTKQYEQKKAETNITLWGQNRHLMREELEKAEADKAHQCQPTEVEWPWPILQKSKDQNEGDDVMDMELDENDQDSDNSTDEKDKKEIAYIKNLVGRKIGSCRIITIEPVSPIPTMNVWAPTQRNQAVSDEVKTDTHIPYFGEDTFEKDKELIDLLEKDFEKAAKAVKREREAQPGDEEDKDDYIFYHMIRALMEEEKNSQNIDPDDKSGGASGFSANAGPSTATYDSSNSNEDIEMPSEQILQKILLAWHSDQSIAQLCAKFRKIAQKMNPTMSCESTSDNINAGNIDGDHHVKQRRNKTMDTFHRTFCRRCFTYNCQTHLESIEHVFPEYRRKIGPFMISNGPCSPDCYMVPDESNSSRLVSLEWTAGDTNMYIALMNVYPGNFCVIGKIMGKPCTLVKLKGLEESKNMPPSEEVPDEALAGVEKIAVEPVQSTSKSGKGKKGNPLKRLRPARPISPNARYTPCFHPGQPCDPTNMECSCKEANTYCEKYCNCETQCKNRFQGCWCHGNCSSGVCPCHAAGRECDPDLCKNHGDSCKNNVIQKGKHKHLRLAKSGIPEAGWGIFTKDSIAKGEFIYEYAGELITHPEAERRAIAYDKRCHTYLFELNDHFMIDAMLKGNKMRFANHSDNANCDVKTLMVSGDHRIGVFAKRNIEAEEELFIYYKSVLMTHQEEQEKRAKVRKRKVTSRKTCKMVKEEKN